MSVMSFMSMVCAVMDDGAAIASVAEKTAAARTDDPARPEQQGKSLQNLMEGLYRSARC
jgi:hypothetical protein